MQPKYHEYWRSNLAICVFGSFSTVFAMTLMLPFLPLFVEELGVQGHAAVVQLSGLAYSATFISAGLIAPIWGRLGDRYGRKSMLVRASLGMALMVSLMGLVTNIWQLLGLRLLVGLAGGYSSGATILIAVQAPKDRSAWALGMVASGVMAGNLAGPLVGGWLPPLIGIRATFLLAGALIFFSFIMTLFLLKERVQAPKSQKSKTHFTWAQIPNKRKVICMLATGLLLMFANMSIEPIITLYVRTLVTDQNQVTQTAGYVMAAAALGSILSASQLGKLADKLGHGKVILVALILSSLLLIPQALVSTGWQLVALRFLMGLALGGILPCIAAVLRHNVPDNAVGSVMGFSVSAQFAGQFLGPMIGGFIGGHLGMGSVFVTTAALLLVGALYNFNTIRNSASY